MRPKREHKACTEDPTSRMSSEDSMACERLVSRTLLHTNQYCHCTRLVFLRHTKSQGSNVDADSTDRVHRTKAKKNQHSNREQDTGVPAYPTARDAGTPTRATFTRDRSGSACQYFRPRTEPTAKTYSMRNNQSEEGLHKVSSIIV